MGRLRLTSACKVVVACTPCLVSAVTPNKPHAITHLLRLRLLHPTFHDIHVDLLSLVRLGPSGLVVFPDIWAKNSLSPLDSFALILSGARRRMLPLRINDESLLRLRHVGDPRVGDERLRTKSGRAERTAAGVSALRKGKHAEYARVTYYELVYHPVVWPVPVDVDMVGDGFETGC